MMSTGLPDEFRMRLPHRKPFLFVDRVESCAGGTASAEWRIDGEEEFLRGHFPGRPIVPGVLLGEALAQTAGIALMSVDGLQIAASAGGYLAQVNLKFPATARPPVAIRLLASHVGTFQDLHLFEVTASQGAAVFAKGQLALATPPQQSRGVSGLMPR
jgi:3-hydroxyacyl-[acyl-carrier-protein] dehydratase